MRLDDCYLIAISIARAMMQTFDIIWEWPCVASGANHTKRGVTLDTLTFKPRICKAGILGVISAGGATMHTTRARLQRR